MSRRGPLSWILPGLLMLCPVGDAEAGATITILNLDGPGEGFNDPTPWTPVGGNPATTVGEARLIAMQFAAERWSCVLSSEVEIRVGASFDPLFCTSTEAALGSAGPNTYWREHPGSPLPDTWFVDALADAQFGSDINPGEPDIYASFHSRIGDLGCLDGFSW